LAVGRRSAGDTDGFRSAAPAALRPDLDRRLLGADHPNQEAAGNLFAVAFPFGMISSAFTPPSLMPEWLGAIAMWNPVSSTANATRELFGNPIAGGGSWIEENAMLMAVIWPLLITAVFLPLAVRKFQKLSR
jgi:ABC-type multidrug transport system permease subunit